MASSCPILLRALLHFQLYSSCISRGDKSLCVYSNARKREGIQSCTRCKYQALKAVLFLHLRNVQLVELSFALGSAFRATSQQGPPHALGRWWRGPTVTFATSFSALGSTPYIKQVFLWNSRQKLTFCKDSYTGLKVHIWSNLYVLLPVCVLDTSSVNLSPFFVLWLWIWWLCSSSSSSWNTALIKANHSIACRMTYTKSNLCGCQ